MTEARDDTDGLDVSRIDASVRFLSSAHYDYECARLRSDRGFDD